MRSSHPCRASTWSTTWFSTFWRQRISTAATATSAAFVDRVLRADQAAAFEGPRSRKPHSRFPRHYYYNPNHGRQHTQYRSRSQGRGSDSSRTDEWGTSRNSGGRPLGRWNNSKDNMSSHHRPQVHGFHLSGLGCAFANEQNLNVRSLSLHRTPIPPAFGLFIGNLSIYGD